MKPRHEMNHDELVEEFVGWSKVDSNESFKAAAKEIDSLRAEVESLKALRSCEGNDIIADCGWEILARSHWDSLKKSRAENAELKKHLRECSSELRGLMGHAIRGDGMDWRNTRNALCDAEDYLNGR